MALFLFPAVLIVFLIYIHNRKKNVMSIAEAVL